jgi:hypothetical protein
MVLAQGLGGLADLALAGQEHQHVTRPGAMRLVDRIDDGVVEVAVLLLVEGAEACLDRIQAPGNLDHRCRPSMKKCRLKRSASSVAEVTISFRSRRFGSSCFR